MAPMFVSEEKAAAALGIPQEKFEREVVDRGLLQEFRDRNRKMYRFISNSRQKKGGQGHPHSRIA